MRYRKGTILIYYMLIIISIVLLAAASFLASGILFQHQRLLTFLGLAGIIFEMQWLLLTLLDRTLLRSTVTEIVFLIGSGLLFVIWLYFRKLWHMPCLHTTGSGRKDMWILPMLVAVLISSFFISRANGFNELTWISHGFYNGDTATFAALTQRSFFTSDLLDKNPFAGNGSLEYPTLLHAGIATFLWALGVGTQWLHFLPVIVLIQLLITIPMFFLLWDSLYPEPKEDYTKWLGISSRHIVFLVQTLLAGYVATLSWDNYVYPQSHFFLTGAFLLLASLLIQAKVISAKTSLWLATAGFIGLILVFSNAVTGTAAIAVLMAFFATQANSKKLTVNVRMLSVILIALFAGIFLIANPGDGSFGLPQFSYMAAGDMLRLAPIVMAIIVAMFLSFSYLPVSAAAVMLLFTLGFITFFFSTRNIVVDNASRFFYHGILIGFPFLLSPLIRLYYYLRREIKYTTHTLTELVVAWAGVMCVALFFLLPAGASVSSAFDNLLFKDTQEVSALEREALWWVNDHIDPNAIILASPHAPFSIPYFTGRSVLRTDYWLSPDDKILEDVKAAFIGDIAAREIVLTHVNYLYLRKSEREQWEPLPLEKVFDNSGAVIYKVR